MSPVTFTSCGVIAGCPVAPALSKLALYRPCKAVASKSAFVCTDKHTQHRLKQLLLPGEPPVLHLVKDLGVDSAGARRRRVANSNARINKAAGRSGKLKRT